MSAINKVAPELKMQQAQQAQFDANLDGMLEALTGAYNRMAKANNNKGNLS
ncbi:MAG: hypothetical protein V4691_00875 [Pseudomonadota bacterium]